MVDKADIEEYFIPSDTSTEEKIEKAQATMLSKYQEKKTSEKSDESEEDEYEYYDMSNTSIEGVSDAEECVKDQNMPPPSEELKRFQHKYFEGLRKEDPQKYSDKTSESSKESRLDTDKASNETCQGISSLSLESRSVDENSQNGESWKEGVKTIENSGADGDVIVMALSYISAARDLVKMKDVLKNNAGRNLAAEIYNKENEVKYFETKCQNKLLQSSDKWDRVQSQDATAKTTYLQKPEMRQFIYNEYVLAKTYECVESLLRPAAEPFEEKLKFDKVVDSLADDF